MIFVDTSAWFAAIVPSDPNHTKAAIWLETVAEPLFTTDYIVDETLTLLTARGERRRALEIGSRFFDGSIAILHRLSSDDIEHAWHVFRDFNDKEWSFTELHKQDYLGTIRHLDSLCF